MDEKKSVQETNSGVKKTGNWKEIAEFGEEVEKALKGFADEESAEKFREWRPKVEESERDVKQKTVEKAKLDEKELEKQSDGVKNDLEEASKEAAAAGKEAVKMDNPGDEVKKASKDAAKPFYSDLAQVFRSLENFVYSNIVLKLNPYYLDTQDFSADIRHRKGTKFEMVVSVPKKEQRQKLKQEFKGR